MRSHPFASLALAFLAACQPSVEGWWGGSIGDAPRTLRLEQTGSAIEGEICSEDACEPLHGSLDEDWLELTYGCASCSLPESKLHLQLTQGEALDGDAEEIGCGCPAAPAPCTCNPRAHFVACDGPC